MFENLMVFMIGATVVIIIPGLTTPYAIAMAPESIGNAVVEVLGIVVGDIDFISLVSLGLAAVIQQWLSLLFAIKFAGAIFLGRGPTYVWETTSRNVQLC